jgi:hypothetical protein
MSRVEYLEVQPWSQSNTDAHTLQGLVVGRKLMANNDPSKLVWIIPLSRYHEPQPPEGYVVTFACLHERGFNAPANKFMRGLCYHYGVKLHNFVPNAISQAATFVGVCEGFLGVPVSWDLRLHLFRRELFAMPTGSKGKHRPVHIGGLTFALWDTGNDVYPTCNMTTNNADWDKGWFYLRNDGASLPPYTGKVLASRPFNWALRVSDSVRWTKLKPYLKALRTLTQAGLTATTVVTQCH